MSALLSTGDLLAEGRTPSVGYRRDIDGLRAIAIVPVILFHSHVAAFSGGYLGVDVFFVVSGYLITSLIGPEIAQGRFSYLSFWERRARRLLPAMFLVVAATAFAAYWILLPGELIAFAGSVVSIVFFSSNVYFWQHADYFDAAQTMPLLHTWSLAVEEQFYLLFPAVLIAVSWSKRLHPVAIVIMIGAASLLDQRVVDACVSERRLLPASVARLGADAGCFVGAVASIAQRLPLTVRHRRSDSDRTLPDFDSSIPVRREYALSGTRRAGPVRRHGARDLVRRPGRPRCTTPRQSADRLHRPTVVLTLPVALAPHPVRYHGAPPRIVVAHRNTDPRCIGCYVHMLVVVVRTCREPHSTANNPDDSTFAVRDPGY